MVSVIKRIATETRPVHQLHSKGEVISDYEDLPEVDVVDSAYPSDWAAKVRKHFGVRYIGEWAWLYKKNNTFGMPVPCCQRSFAYFESMLSNNKSPIPNELYQIDTSTVIKG